MSIATEAIERMAKICPRIKELPPELVMSCCNLFEELAPTLAENWLVVAHWVQSQATLGHIDVGVVRQLLEAEKLARELAADRIIGGFSPVPLTNLELKPNDESDDALIGTFWFLGTPMHLQLVRVTVDDQGIQNTVDDRFSHELEHLERITGERGPFATTKLPGHEGEYVCYSYPHSR